MQSFGYDGEDLQAVHERRRLIGRYDAWLLDECLAYLGQHRLEISCGLGSHMRQRDVAYLRCTRTGRARAVAAAAAHYWPRGTRAGLTPCSANG
jgi:hypothetical protein